MEDYRRLAWKLAPAPWYHVDGSLAWFGDRARSAALRDQVRRLQDWGYAAEMLPAAEVLENLEPGLTFADPGTPVAWFPEEAWVDPRALTQRLVEGVRNAGGRVLTGSDGRSSPSALEAGRVSSLTLAGGQSIPIAAVVNAAGVDAVHVAALVGRRLPVLAPRSLAVRAELPDGGDPLRRPIRTDGIAVRPDGPGRVLLVPHGEPGDRPPGPVPLDDPRVGEAIIGGRRGRSRAGLGTTDRGARGRLATDGTTDRPAWGLSRVSPATSKRSPTTVSRWRR